MARPEKVKPRGQGSENTIKESKERLARAFPSFFTVINIEGEQGIRIQDKRLTLFSGLDLAQQAEIVLAIRHVKEGIINPEETLEFLLKVQKALLETRKKLGEFINSYEHTVDLGERQGIKAFGLAAIRRAVKDVRACQHYSNFLGGLDQQISTVNHLIINLTNIDL